MFSWIRDKRQDGKVYSPLSCVHEDPRTLPRPWSIGLPKFIAIILLTNILSILFASYSSVSRTLDTYSQDIQGLRKVYPGLDRSFHKTTFSNFRGNNTSSRWTATPSKAVDKAWVELGVRDTGFLLPHTVGRDVFGLDRRTNVYVPQGLVAGEREGFPVFVQALHDLHCLNELRKSLYFNHDYYRQFENHTENPEWFRQAHINHCIDNIRLQLMCSADATVIPSVWVRPEENFLLFANDRKCHDYDALMHWVDAWHRDNVDQLLEGKSLTTPSDVIFADPSDFE